MLGLLFIITVAGAAQGWQSKFFQDVQLHTGQPPVTVQVAWLEPKDVSTDSVMPAVVSVFSGHHGERRLVSSTRVGNVGFPHDVGFFQDEPSGECFLSLSLKAAVKWQTCIFRFDRNRPLIVLRRRRLWPEHHDGRFVITEDSLAKDVGLKIRKDDHPNPPAEGREVLVPDRLWKTCFDPNLGLEHHLSAKISKDGKRVTVVMSGADAGGGYRATWTLRPNGKHTRKFDDSC
ncbi:MAG: hypothetical protein ACR2HJ_05495 [Fimbriimonadales bacterium]